MSRTITIDIFDQTSIDKAIRELRDYKKLVIEKAEELRKRVALLIRQNAEYVYSFSVADDLINEPAIIDGVQVSVEENGNVTLVIASGQDAIFMEFGAGIYHNGPAGSSPHPLGSGLGFTIGSYGLGNGRKNVWGFRGTDGEFHLTHGTPASMPLYRATMAVVNDIERIAREVFNL